MKNSKYIKIISFLIALCIMLLIGYRFISFSGFEVTISNKTDLDITDLELSCVSYGITDKVIELPVIKASQKKKAKFELQKDFGEGSIMLSYFDKNEVLHEENISGYIEGHDRGKISVIIKGVDEDGIIEFDVIETL